MHGLMNNTKWRELLTLLSSYQIYIQLKCVDDDDFPLDVERPDWIISNIEDSTFVFVRRKFQYHEIDKIKIITDSLPLGASRDQFESLFENIRAITNNELVPIEDGVILNGYCDNVS